MTANYILFIIAGFMSGSVLYSYLVPRLAKNVDITALSDDKNPGASNAFRHAGIGLGVLCLLFDLAKGFFPVWLAKACLNISSPLFVPIIIAPVLGHAFSPLKHFNGGKAIATSFGVLLALVSYTPAALLLAGLYVLMLVLSPIRPNEKKTVFAFALFALIQWLFNCPLTLKIGASLVSATVILKNLHDAFASDACEDKAAITKREQ